VPLYTHDLLFPQEGDDVVTNDNHNRCYLYLYSALRRVLAGRPGARVFADHRVDFQVPGLQPLGPDVTVLVGTAGEWNPLHGTFPVKTYGGRPALVVEVTSPSTRELDVDDKFDLYHRAGVGVYLLADVPPGGDPPRMEVDGYEWSVEGYRRMGWDADGTVWVPELGVGFRPDGLRLVVIGPNRQPVPDSDELAAEVDQLLADLRAAEAAVGRAAAERDAAAAERDAAAAERDAAAAERDAAAAERDRATRALHAEQQRAAELEAELRRLRGDNT
jgi:Uma2 family endonuclease